MAINVRSTRNLVMPLKSWTGIALKGARDGDGGGALERSPTLMLGMAGFSPRNLVILSALYPCLHAVMLLFSPRITTWFRSLRSLVLRFMRTMSYNGHAVAGGITRRARMCRRRRVSVESKKHQAPDHTFVTCALMCLTFAKATKCEKHVLCPRAMRWHASSGSYRHSPPATRKHENVRRYTAASMPYSSALPYATGASW